MLASYGVVWCSPDIDPQISDGDALFCCSFSKAGTEDAAGVATASWRYQFWLLPGWKFLLCQEVFMKLVDEQFKSLQGDLSRQDDLITRSE